MSGRRARLNARPEARGKYRPAPTPRIRPGMGSGLEAPGLVTQQSTCQELQTQRSTALGMTPARSCALGCARRSCVKYEALAPAWLPAPAVRHRVALGDHADRDRAPRVCLPRGWGARRTPSPISTTCLRRTISSRIARATTASPARLRAREPRAATHPAPVRRQLGREPRR